MRCFFDTSIADSFSSSSIEELDDFRAFLEWSALCADRVLNMRLISIGHANLDLSKNVLSQLGRRWYIIDCDGVFQIRTYNNNPGQNSYNIPIETKSYEAGGVWIVDLPEHQLALSSHLRSGQLTLSDVSG